MDGGDSTAQSAEPMDAEAPLPAKQATVDLASHPVHGNLLTMQQTDAARLLGVNTIMLNSRFRASHPNVRWPWRRHSMLKTQIRRTKELYKQGKITKPVRKARVKCFKAEMALLVKGPVEISLESK